MNRVRRSEEKNSCVNIYTWHTLKLFHMAVQEMPGLLIDTCTNVEFDGLLLVDAIGVDDPAFNAPTGGEQVANVVITGNSSGIVFKGFIVGPGVGKLLYSGGSPKH